MRVERGECRTVIILPLLGIVVKLPIIQFKKGVAAIRYHYRRGRLVRGFLKYGMQKGQIDPLTIRRPLFKGIITNWLEFWFYASTRHAFLQPTFFSLFGFVNIQRAGVLCGMSPEELELGLNCVVDKDVLAKDDHHFDNPDNFVITAVGLRMVDYGWPETQKIILLHGDKIFEYFCQERCKKER